jgi:hypothetical protein
MRFDAIALERAETAAAAVRKADPMRHTALLGLICIGF